MTNFLFTSIITDGLAGSSFAICTVISLAAGLVIALTGKFRTRSTPSFSICLALLPVTVQLVIMLVNGNLGAGVAVAGAFSLVRFRSAPGSAREILSIFSAMAVGLATGMGYCGIAVIFTVIISIMTIAYTALRLGESKVSSKDLKVTIPEDLDYSEIFDDLFKEYTVKHELVKVRTANMGSLFQLTYHIELTDVKREKEFIDKIRTRNGNLEIVCTRNLGTGDAL